MKFKIKFHNQNFNIKEKVIIEIENKLNKFIKILIKMIYNYLFYLQKIIQIKKLLLSKKNFKKIKQLRIQIKTQKNLIKKEIQFLHNGSPMKNYQKQKKSNKKN